MGLMLYRRNHECSSKAKPCRSIKRALPRFIRIAVLPSSTARMKQSFLKKAQPQDLSCDLGAWGQPPTTSRILILGSKCPACLYYRNVPIIIEIGTFILSEPNVRNPVIIRNFALIVPIKNWVMITMPKRAQEWSDQNFR